MAPWSTMFASATSARPPASPARTPTSSSSTARSALASTKTSETEPPTTRSSRARSKNLLAVKSTSTLCAVPVRADDTASPLEPRSWTWNTNAPLIGWESAETARYAAVYVPGARSPSMPTTISVACGCVTSPSSTRLPWPSNTRSEPSEASTGSLNSRSTSSGACASTTSFPGSVPMRIEWASAPGAASRAVTSAAASAATLPRRPVPFRRIVALLSSGCSRSRCGHPETASPTLLFSQVAGMPGDVPVQPPGPRPDARRRPLGD